MSEGGYKKRRRLYSDSSDTSASDSDAQINHAPPNKKHYARRNKNTLVGVLSQSNTDQTYFSAREDAILVHAWTRAAETRKSDCADVFWESVQWGYSLRVQTYLQLFTEAYSDAFSEVDYKYRELAQCILELVELQDTYYAEDLVEDGHLLYRKKSIAELRNRFNHLAEMVKIETELSVKNGQMVRHLEVLEKTPLFRRLLLEIRGVDDWSPGSLSHKVRRGSDADYMPHTPVSKQSVAPDRLAMHTAYLEKKTVELREECALIDRKTRTCTMITQDLQEVDWGLDHYVGESEMRELLLTARAALETELKTKLDRDR